MFHRHHPEPPDAEWRDAASGVLAHWQHLDPDEETRVIQGAWELTQTRGWEGLDGLSITPQMKAVISTSACLLTVNVGLRVLADVTSILVAPTSATRATRQSLGGKVVGELVACVLGESLLHGPVRLSWDRIRAEQRDWSTSVLLHEFAHKIDMADGVGSGTPPITDHGEARRFEQVVSSALTELREDSDPSPLSSYAATNAAELFAVATETFFLNPDGLHDRFGDLFEALETYYRQRPVVVPET